MTQKKIALLVISTSLLAVFSLLNGLNIINGKTLTFLILITICVLCYTSYNLLNDFKFENNYFKLMVSLFLFYEFIIVIRGWSFSYDALKTFLQAGFVFWPFIIPIFVFFDKNINSFGYLLKWIFYIGIFFLVVSFIYPPLLLNRLTAESFISLIVPCGFLLLNASYLKNTKVNVSTLLLFIGILSLTYLARRSSLFNILGFVISAYFLNLLNKSKARIFQFFPLLLIIGAFILFSKYFDNSREVLFNKMTLRFSEDTRSDLYRMFLSDMKGNILLGKGMNGTYFYPFYGTFEVDGVTFEEVDFRNIIENGYLQLMLTGGVLHVVLFLLILLPAALKGMFMSSNQFTKACGVLIFLRLLDMILFGLPTLSLPYILVWICVGICYKPSIRRLKDDEILTEFEKIGLL
jgi:hypothetical protein